MERLRHDHHEDVILNQDFDLYKRKDYLEYRRQWKDLPALGVVSPYPLNLDVFVTSRCNLKCVMCSRTKKVEHGVADREGDLEFDLYRKIIDEAAAEGVCAVHLTGNGEPLLHPRIVEMISYARAKNILDLFMHTNATLLDRAMSRAILDAGLTRLIISIDSPRKETYESIRVGARFDEVMENIRAFVEMKKPVKYPIMRVQMVKMRANEEEVEEYDRLFGALADVIGYTDYINYFGMDEGKDTREKRFRKDFVCRHLWRRLTVEVDGSVYACIPAPEGVRLGSAEERTVKDLWHGERMAELRRLYSTGQAESLRDCCTCGRQFK